MSRLTIAQRDELAAEAQTAQANKRLQLEHEASVAGNLSRGVLPAAIHVRAGQGAHNR